MVGGIEKPVLFEVTRTLESEFDPGVFEGGDAIAPQFYFDFVARRDNHQIDYAGSERKSPQEGTKSADAEEVLI